MDIIKNMIKALLEDIEYTLRVFWLILIIIGMFLIMIGIPIGVFWCVSEIFSLNLTIDSIVLYTLIFLIIFGIVASYLENLYNRAKDRKN